MKTFSQKSTLVYGALLLVFTFFKVSSTDAQADARITKVFAMSEYHSIPFDQVLDSLDFGVMVKNEGTTTLTNVQMKYELSHQGSVILSDSLIEDSIVSGNTALMQMSSSFVPNTKGVYNASYTITHDEVDATPLDNSSTIDTLIVSDTILQRYRNTNIGGSFCPPNLTQGEMGSIYSLNRSASLSSVTAGISNMGNRLTQLKLSANIRAFVNGKPGSILASSDTILISNYNSQFVTLRFNPPLNLGTDTFMLSMVQEDSCISLGATSYGQIAINDQGAYWFWSSGLQNGNWVTYPSSNNNLGLMIRPNFGGSIANQLQERDQKIKDLKVFPNPITDQARVHFSLKENANVELTIRDLLGRTVSQEFSKNLTAGSYDHTLSRSEIKGEKGVYILLFKVDGQTYSQKIFVL